MAALEASSSIASNSIGGIIVEHAPGLGKYSYSLVIFSSGHSCRDAGENCAVGRDPGISKL